MNQLPTPERLLEWLRDNPTTTTKRDIARAFGLKGAGKVALKQMMAELAREGRIEKRARRARPAGDLPPVLVLRVVLVDAGGDLWGEPEEWEADAPAPAS